jgi:hypothetical protein
MVLISCLAQPVMTHKTCSSLCLVSVAANCFMYEAVNKCVKEMCIRPDVKENKLLVTFIKLYSKVKAIYL